MEKLLQAELARQLAADATLAEVKRALHELFGLAVTVLSRGRSGISELFPPPASRRLNPLCASVRSREEGLRRCATCQTSLALRAPLEGISQHPCHIGATILALPAEGSRPRVADMLVVASGAFVRDQEQVERVFQNLLALRIPPDRARKACDSLPTLTDSDYSKVKHFLIIASIVVGRTLESLLHKMNMGRLPVNGVPTPSGMNRALHAVFTSSDAGEEVSSTRTGNRIVDAIVDLVSRTPEMHYTLDNLGVAAGVSANHLSTLFHRHYGAPFSEFLVEQRVKAAMRRLRDPLQSVEEVARLSGFNNVSYFCRCFKQHTGSTPGQWRRRRLGVKSTAPGTPGAAPVQPGADTGSLEVGCGGSGAPD